MAEKLNWLRKLNPLSKFQTYAQENGPRGMRSFFSKIKLEFSSSFRTPLRYRKAFTKLVKPIIHRVQCAQPMRYAFVTVYCVQKHSTIRITENFQWFDFPRGFYHSLPFIWQDRAPIRNKPNGPRTGKIRSRNRALDNISKISILRKHICSLFTFYWPTTP